MSTVAMSADELRARLDTDRRSTPADRSVPRAAVAAIFRAAGGAGATELLFIQRAVRPSDPWSGQMAFPGGRAAPADVSELDTAVRETREEVGLDLERAAYLGALTELDGGRATNRRVDVSAHGFWLDGDRPRLTPNYEVADAVWVDLATLSDPSRYIEYLYPPAGVTFPGIQLDRGDQVIWGLTLRFLADLFARLELPFII